MKVRIDIDTSTLVRFWLVVIGFVFAIWLVYLSRVGLVIVGSAMFLALALSGPVNKLRDFIPGRSRIGATAAAFSIIVILIGMFGALVVPPIVQQTARLLESVPQLVDTARTQWDGVGVFIEKYHLEPQLDQAVESIRSSSSEFISGFSRNVISGVGSLFSAIGMIFLALVLAFLMLIEGPEWLRRIWGVYQDQDLMESHRSLAERMHLVVSGYVTGQLTVSGIGALCAGATVFLMSMFIPEVPGNLAMPTIAIAFLFSLIPMFGSTIAGILVSLLLAVNSLPAAIIFAVYFIVYQQIENNFISPQIQSKYVKLSPLAVLVAVTIGLYLFGLAGGIVSIPIAGCIKVLIEEYLALRRKQRKKKAKKPIQRLMRKLEDA